MTACSAFVLYGIQPRSSSSVDGAPVLNRSPPRVLLASSKTQASRLAPLLIERGLRPIWCPTVEEVPLTDEASLTDLDDALWRLSEYDYLLLPCRASIDAVAFRMRRLFEEPDTVKVGELLELSGAKVGSLSRDALLLRSAIGVVADIVSPAGESLAGLVDLIVEDSRGRRGRPLLVLIPCSTSAGARNGFGGVPELAHRLESFGMQVSLCAAFATIPIRRTSVRTELDLLLEGRIDCVVFSSAMDVEHFHAAYIQDAPFPAVTAAVTEEAARALQEAHQLSPLVRAAGPDALRSIADQLETLLCFGSSEVSTNGLIFPRSCME